MVAKSSSHEWRKFRVSGDEKEHAERIEQTDVFVRDRASSDKALGQVQGVKRTSVPIQRGRITALAEWRQRGASQRQQTAVTGKR